MAPEYLVNTKGINKDSKIMSALGLSPEDCRISSGFFDEVGEKSEDRSLILIEGGEDALRITFFYPDKVDVRPVRDSSQAGQWLEPDLNAAGFYNSGNAIEIERLAGLPSGKESLIRIFREPPNTLAFHRIKVFTKGKFREVKGEACFQFQGATVIYPHVFQRTVFVFPYSEKEAAGQILQKIREH